MSAKDTTTEDGAEWFLSDGSPYRGEAFQDDAGKPFGEAYVACGRCAGTGKWRLGRKTGSCGTCGGDKENFEQVRIYTAKQIESKERQRVKRAETKRTEQGRRDSERGELWSQYSKANAPLLARAVASGDTWIAEILAKAEIKGGMTPNQESAVSDKLDRIEADQAAYIHSQPVAEPGQRIEVEVVCRARGSFMSKGFGRRKKPREVFVTEMLDGEGNAYISVTENFKLDAGDRALLRATVKEHDSERKSWTRTHLTRVVILELTHAPNPPAEAAEADHAPEEEALSPSM